MMHAIKSEFRKLMSVRSNYVIFAVILILLGLAELYVAGYRDASTQASSFHVMNELYQVINFTGFLVALVSLLHITQEYRFNTITYTLVNTHKRWRVFASKLSVLSAYAVVITLLLGLLTYAFIWLGFFAHGVRLPAQTIYFSDVLARTIFVNWGYVVMAYFIGILWRNQVAAIMTLFLAPGMIEGLLGLVLKDNVSYLPFTALNNVLTEGAQFGNGKAALVFLMDAGIIGVLSYLLFMKRDAN